MLALDVDIKDELPADDSGYGFDNIADVLTVSPTLMERYIRVAGKISKLAVGLGMILPFSTIYTLIGELQLVEPEEEGLISIQVLP